MLKLINCFPKLPASNLAAWIARARWIKSARKDQLTPKKNWRVWLILAGRGWGKTRTGAEDIAAYVLWNPCVRVGVIAPTFADARDVCIEGESGLLKILPRACVKSWRRTTGDLTLFNGSRVKIFSADQPDRLRGPQHHRVWCDELCAWSTMNAFDQMWFGLRLGDDPRVVVTTTPRNSDLLRELMARDDVYLTRGKTADNKKNLAASVLEQLKRRYEGTRLGRQELNAEVLEDFEDALWKRGDIDKNRVVAAPKLVRTVVAIDPAMSHNASSDETGIVAAGLCEKGTIYILDDWSCKASPERWAQRSIELYKHVGADMIVGEVNAGGDMIARILKQCAPELYFKPVRAVKGKIGRALPVAALYERGQVKHVGCLSKLEDQMMRFTPDAVLKNSPDRVDALVWAVTELSESLRREPRVRSL